MRGHRQQEHLDALDRLIRAGRHLAAQFDMSWPRAIAQANLDARALIFNASNAILREHGLGITEADLKNTRIPVEGIVR